MKVDSAGAASGLVGAEKAFVAGESSLAAAVVDKVEAELSFAAAETSLRMAEASSARVESGSVGTEFNFRSVKIMPRQRKSATRQHLDATERLANLKSIDAALDLGTGLSNAALGAAIAAADSNLDAYNQTLALSDTQLNAYDQSVKVAQDIAVRMLSGVGAKYGYDSNEYEQAGGTRKSERAKPVRAAKTKETKE